MKTLGALGLMFLLAACRAEVDKKSEPVLRFSAIPDESTTELMAKYDPVAEYLGRRLGIKVEYRPSSDYGASVEMFRNGDIHLAWFGGLTGVQARAAVKGARAIAQGAEDPEYYSYFIAHKDAGIEESSDFPAAIAGLRFTFGSERSTSGRLMPEYYIRRNSGGKELAEFFAAQYGFSGAHDKTVELVNAGTYQAGVLSYKTYDRLKAAGKADNTRVIWRTPVYADYNFTAHPELERMFGPGFIDRLQAALIAMDGEMTERSFLRSALIKADNEDFAELAGTARELGLLR